MMGPYGQNDSRELEGLEEAGTDPSFERDIPQRTRLQVALKRPGVSSHPSFQEDPLQDQRQRKLRGVGQVDQRARVVVPALHGGKTARSSPEWV